MSFTRTARPTIPTLTTEVPLRTFDQIRIGTYLTGPGLRKFWMVVDILGPDSVGCLPLPINLAACGPGRHTLTRQGLYGQICACGYRVFGNLVPDVPQGNLVSTGTPSTYLLTAPSRPVTPVRGTIYAYRGTGGVVAFTSLTNQGTWSVGALPVFPSLRPVWSVPEEWRDQV